MKLRLLSIARYIARAILIAFATLYFLIDVLFLSLLRPLRRRLMALRLLQRMQAWVDGQNRYVALLLLGVPWVILEPIKPVAFVLFAHKRHLAATVLIVVGEIIKLTLVDQIFHMTRPKLMTFAWFAWGYGKWQAALAYLRSLPAWRRIVRTYRSTRAWLRRRRRMLIDGLHRWRISQHRE
jgi:hypothetical protein